MTRRAQFAMPADILVGESPAQYHERKAKDYTPLFPRKIKPARPGVYRVTMEISYSLHTSYSRWDGKQWNLTAGSPDSAEQQIVKSAACYGPNMRGWQGLAHDPAGVRK